MITIIIFISILMIMFTAKSVNGASTRRRRRRGIDWSGVKSAQSPTPEKTAENEEALKK
jgi:hypothetical protein